MMASVPGTFPDESNTMFEATGSNMVMEPDLNITWTSPCIPQRRANWRGWHSATITTILEQIPENLIVNEQLQYILLWSLQRLDDPAKPALAENAKSDNMPEGLCEAQLRSSMDALPSPTTSSSPIQSANPPISVLKKRSRKTSHLWDRLRKLRQDTATKEETSSVVATIDSTPTADNRAALNGECISCFDDFPMADLVSLACSHDYCKPCLCKVILTAVKTESAFPPKCCLVEVPLKTVLVCLDNKQRDEYKDKSAEYSIPAGHRWYCPEPKCSKWIKPEKLHRNRKFHQTCPYCKANICSHCRSLAHGRNIDCPQDFGLESTLEIAESEGWRRCYSCRTMVELTTGCRHITCRCGAEFCYVCNARWRTCRCTEEDKDRRIRELQASRAERERLQAERDRQQQEEDAAAQVEADEVAEAIRQVEELERQEAAQRAEEERRRQLEEELALARLEEARLLEEIARREAEEEAERQFRRILIASSKEECQAMIKALFDIIAFQQSALSSKHETEEQVLLYQKETQRVEKMAESAKMASWLKENINTRIVALQAKHDQERTILQQKTEEEEDKFFMEMHIFFKDKPNREAREMKMCDSFQKQHFEKQEKLQRRQDDERLKLDKGISYELEGLRKAESVQLEPIETQFHKSLRTLESTIHFDRHWFELVSQRRLAMLKEHRKLILENLEAEEEPVGLTEEKARLIEPLLPAFDDNQPGPSRANHLFENDQLVNHTELLDDQQETSDMYGAAVELPSHASSPAPEAVVSEIGDHASQPTAADLQRLARNTLSADSEMAEPTAREMLGQLLAAGSNHMGNHTSANSPTRYLNHSDTICRKPIPGAYPLTQPLIESIKPSPLQPSKTNVGQAVTMSSTLGLSLSPQLSSSQSTSPPTSVGTERTRADRGSTTATSTISSGKDIVSGISGRTSREKKKRFFGGFGRRKDISEEEIKRRMSRCAGDGYGL